MPDSEIPEYSDSIDAQGKSTRSILLQKNNFRVAHYNCKAVLLFLCLLPVVRGQSVNGASFYHGNGAPGAGIYSLIDYYNGASDFFDMFNYYSVSMGCIIGGKRMLMWEVIRSNRWPRSVSNFSLGMRCSF